jgi:hypothetical protein
LGEIPLQYKPLIKVFPSWLALATAERPISPLYSLPILLLFFEHRKIILFIDSLDQITEEFASELNWIPSRLPSHVYLVVSSIGGIASLPSYSISFI